MSDLFVNASPSTMPGDSDPRPGRGRLLVATLGAAVGVAGFAASLTSAYLGMRDVMRTSGGFCASGGPYVIAQQCSSSDTQMLLFGILGLLASAGVYAAFTSWVDGPVLGGALLMWAALFGAFGWNFIDLGLNPPKGVGGGSGWLVSGVAFWLMALGGLIPVIVMTVGWLRRGGRPEPGFEHAPIVRARVDPMASGSLGRAAQVPGAGLGSAPASVVPKRIVPPGWKEP